MRGERLIFSRCEENNAEMTSTWIKEAELDVERGQKERDELETQSASLRSTADSANELSSHNDDLYHQSETMAQAYSQPKRDTAWWGNRRAIKT